MKRNHYIEILVVILLLGLFSWDRFFLPDVSGDVIQYAVDVNGDKKLPPREFKTDGCTLWPDSLLDYSWQDKCIEHDALYWSGGTEEDRLRADLKLRSEVNEVFPWAGDFIYFGVRVGGRSLNPLIPWPWGWGYGWNNGGTTTVDVIIEEVDSRIEYIKKLDLIDLEI